MPLGRAASGELTRLQIRVVLVPMLRECRTGDPCSKLGPFSPRQALCQIAARQRECPQAGLLLANLPAVRYGIKSTPVREVSPDRNPGLSAHMKPSARAHQTEGAEGLSPACRIGCGRPARMLPGRGRIMRPALFGSAVRTACTPLPAPEFERCRFSRPPQPLPSFVQTLSGCAGLGPAGSLLRHPLERPPGAAVFLCFCRCLPGIRGRLILRAAGIPPSAGPAFGPVQVEGAATRTGGHPFPSRRRASISKSLTSVSGS